MGAYMRAVEHDRDDHIVIDPFAEPLTHQIAPQLAPRLRKWTESLAQPENYIALRTRYLDDAITQRGSGIRQVVLFRAGLDTRPYRLASLQDCHVFEVEQSIELFEHKVHILEALEAQLMPLRHDMIVADVNDFNWEEKLLTAGFDSNIPTFWALDGVTMYLEKASNIALFKTIDILSAPGSEIWGDVGGQALKEGEIAVFKQVDKLSQEELGTHLFRLGDDDPIHGVFSELPWELELQAELGKPGTHFGREWEPVLSVRTKEPVPLSFVHGAKQ
jgi:methyltransferase (TIGR00027 family)